MTLAAKQTKLRALVLNAVRELGCAATALRDETLDTDDLAVFADLVEDSVARVTALAEALVLIEEGDDAGAASPATAPLHAPDGPGDPGDENPPSVPVRAVVLH